MHDKQCLKKSCFNSLDLLMPHNQVMIMYEAENTET